MKTHLIDQVNCSAWVIQDSTNKIISKIIVKYPRKGAKTVKAAVWFWGHLHSEGSAKGYGYDEGAAVGDAFGNARFYLETSEGIKDIVSECGKLHDPDMGAIRKVLEGARYTLEQVV